MAASAAVVKAPDRVGTGDHQVLTQAVRGVIVVVVKRVLRVVLANRQPRNDDHHSRKGRQTACEWRRCSTSFARKTQVGVLHFSRLFPFPTIQPHQPNQMAALIGSTTKPLKSHARQGSRDFRTATASKDFRLLKALDGAYNSVSPGRQEEEGDRSQKLEGQTRTHVRLDSIGVFSWSTILPTPAVRYRRIG